MGNCTLTAGGFRKDIEVTPGCETEILLGQRSPPVVVLSEVCADPQEGYTEWIEIRTDGPLNLSGYQLTDGETIIELPPVTFEGEFLIVYDNSSNIDEGVLHVPMLNVLANAGDEITLIDAQSGVADHMAYGTSTAGPPVIWDQAAAPVGHTGHMAIGGDGWESVGEKVLHAGEYDGLVHLAPFTCMPEIIAENIMPSTRESIPVLTILCDEQIAKAGVLTRLEAFVDLLERKRRAQNIERKVTV